MKLTIKNLRTCAGRNGPDAAFSCSLYIDGKRAAVVRDEGCGGCFSYDWLDRSLEKPFLEHCKALHPEIEFEAEDHVIATLLDALETEKQLKRWCRKSVVFRLVSDSDDAFRTLKVKWPGNEDRVRAHLQGKHGDDLREIVNERFA